MGERRWTEEQLSAIETRDKTLLVSAAAGSGKTATLTERIIRQLTDENPISVDSLLVVTYTTAAASELRAKISHALTEAVEKNPDNKTLKEQLYLLPSAKIRTIDSFCNDILKNNCDRVGVPPNYRIADAAECELLAISIIEGLIEAVYNGELPEIASPEEFEELADCLTDSKRAEELCEVFRVIHLKCEYEEDGVDSLLDLIKKYENPLPVIDNVYGRYIIGEVREMARHYTISLGKRLSVFTPGAGSEDKYIPVLESDLSILKKILGAKDYTEMRDSLLCASFVDLPRGKKVITDNISSYTEMRGLMKADVKDYSKYFEYTEEMWGELFEKLHRLFTVFYRFLARFDAQFLEEKRQRGALSYADIERYTYHCLLKDGEPTDIALNLRERYSAIYIDEYQDVNAIQNRIFEVISRGTNRFMVGDIKQSIYGFRSARPEIFSSMKNSFPKLSEGDGDFAAVFMSKNFRCDKAVVDFVNGVFDRAFTLVGDSIGYEAGDRLGYAKIHDGGEPEYIKPEVCLVDKNAAAEDEEGQGDAPHVVARKISELLAGGKLDNGEPIRPSDIAIIMRNARGKDDRYASALAELGIPSCISGAKDFFLSPEVLLALCLLNSIDNPGRDIYLAGLMCSPLFGFTADELCELRGEFKRGTLYESLVAFCDAHPNFSKGRYFLDRLNYYRTLSECIGVTPLLYKLYHETGLYALAAKNGGKDNLTLLYDYARSFEAGAYKGLYNFISFINNLTDKKTTFDDPRAGSDSDAVKIVTCHSSKGLEYPVVFLVDATSAITNKEKANRFAFAGGFGIAMRLRTPSGLALVKNPVMDIVNYYIDKKNYEEELRVLYVALTRARERLFVVGTSTKGKREEYTAKIDVLREDLSRYSVGTLSSMMEIVLVCGECGVPEYSEDFVADTSALQDAVLTVDEPEAVPEMTEEESAALSSELIRRFKFEYPRAHLTRLPEKMSVSRMSPTVLDGTDAEAAVLVKSEERRRRLPAFADGNKADESAKRGIATHYFLQFCDLKRLEVDGAELELERLKREGFISDADSKRVRLSEIEAFRHSRLFEIMLGAKNIYREFRFNVRLPAVHFTSDEENKELYRDDDILVQGVIDCIVEREDGSLCLYDYKTDRLTREELADRNLAEQKLRDSHKMQLTLYALAAEKIFGKLPDVLEVYSLPLGDTVSMK